MYLAVSRNHEHIISRFCVIGINFQKASATERSLFAITSEKRNYLLTDAKEKGFRSLFVLSTCNRTELYGFCDHDKDLTELLVKHCSGSLDILRNHGFVKKGKEAFEYLFKVAAGLHSQIAGDYEIAGQLKCAVAQSRKQGLIGPLMDRIINYALQASKAVKSSTLLSNGTVSVSYAAIEWLNTIRDIDRKSVLIIGTGSMGRNIAKNVKHYLRPEKIIIMNRTDETARLLAQETGFIFRSFGELSQETRNVDVVIVCTNAPGYLLRKEHFKANKPVTVLDLSVPENAEPGIADIPGVKVIGIDEVSQTLSATFVKRSREIPKAVAIIEEYLNDVYDWLTHYKHIPVIRDVKQKLYGLSSMEYHQSTDTASLIGRRINKAVGELAMNLRDKNEKGCQYISAIHQFLQDNEIAG